MSVPADAAVRDRDILPVESPAGARMDIGGRTILNFGGSAYLGLARERSLIDAGVQALQQLGALNTLPRHYGFSTAPHEAAEAQARRFFQAEDAMFFATGYLFGAIALAALAPQVHAVFIDESAHYNLRDGARAAGLAMHAFAHRDAADLARVMDASLRPGERPLVATDGMFPTHGTVPPLGDYLALVTARGGWLVVDESHAFGAVGPGGRGAVEHAGLDRERVVAGGSMGKAFCAQGGLAIGGRAVIAAMRDTPAGKGAALGMPAAAAMVAASLRTVREQPQHLERLRRNAHRLKAGLRGLGLDIADSPGPVATFSGQDAAAMRRIQAELWQAGIFVIYSTYVGAGPQGALRCAAFADHEPAEIDRLVATLAPLLCGAAAPRHDPCPLVERTP